MALGLDEVIPKRRFPRARAVMITTDEALNQREGDFVTGRFATTKEHKTRHGAAKEGKVTD